MKTKVLLISLCLFLSFCKKTIDENVTAKKPETVKDTITSQQTIKIIKKEKLILEPSLKEDISKKETSELWNKYKNARAKSKDAFNNSDIKTALTELKNSVTYAKKLKRYDLAAWQLNNIGYYSILEFKKRTNFDFRNNQINNIKNKTSKQQYIDATKVILKKELELLSDAEIFLDEAYDLDSKFEENERTEKIQNNKKFITWVNNFINNE